MWEKIKNNGILQIILEICVLLTIIFLVVLFIKLKTDSKVPYHESNTSLLYKKINSSDSELIFKGEPNNNYLTFNNLLWRIVRVNKDGTVLLILDKPINKLPWKYENDYDIIKYLNNEFLNELDKSKLVKNKLCDNEINNLDDIKCENKTSNYVSLLDASSFITSIDNTSFISGEDNLIWLNNSYDGIEYFHTNGSKISHSESTNYYDIKPVVTLNRNTAYEGGNGTINNPYIIKNDKISIGNQVRINNDEFTVISTKNNIKLLANNYIENVSYNDAINYLNTVYYDSLEYKKYLLNNDCNEVIIDNNSIKENKSKNKICMLNIYDLKMNDISDGYLLSKIDNYYIVFDNQIIYGSEGVVHKIYPVITISKNSEFKKENNIYILKK